MFIATTATKKVLSLKKRIRAVQGGTSASKTISILLVLIDLAQRDKIPTLTSVVSESFPHLKRGAIRDFINIMQTQGYYKEANWNKTDYIYTFETGSKIEFFSADQEGKLRGARRDRLFLNEANNIQFIAFEQLEVRTKECIFLDWNPSDEFWFYTEIKDKRTDYDWIILTYLDNEGLDERIKDAIEQRRNRKSWWKVYGEGQLGEVEGKIYTDWNIIDEIPHEAKLERIGNDFGYSNDPDAMVAVYAYNGGFIFDQILYQKGKSNKQLADTWLNLEQRALMIADSAEPKSIDELSMLGVDVMPAVKGADSVNHGIKTIQSQRISVTKRSVDIIKEYRNYLWDVDKNGKIQTWPDPKCDDHAMDACRYAMSTITISHEDELAELRRLAGIRNQSTVNHAS